MPKLVSNISYWEKESLLSGFDFLIVGNGLIGRQIALELRQAHTLARIGIIDRSPFSAGASTRNAGFACFGSITELMADLEHTSEEAVFDLVSKRYRGIELLKQKFGETQIGFVPTGSWEIFTAAEKQELELALSRVEYFNRQMAGITGEKEVFRHSTTGSFGFKDAGSGIVNQLEGQLHSGMLNNAISENVHKSGIVPLYGLTVRHFEDQAASVIIECEEGYTLSCKKLIIATNAFASQLLPSLDIIPARGQVLITKAFDKVPFSGTFHSDGGYIYFRNVGNRILLGGARNRFLEQEQSYTIENTANVLEYLQQYLQEYLLPGRDFEIDMSWSGIMAMGSRGKLPIVQEVSGNILVCARMGGMGVALGAVLAEEVAARYK